MNRAPSEDGSAAGKGNMSGEGHDGRRESMFGLCRRRWPHLTVKRRSILEPVGKFTNASHWSLAEPPREVMESHNNSMAVLERAQLASVHLSGSLQVHGHRWID